MDNRILARLAARLGKAHRYNRGPRAADGTAIAGKAKSRKRAIAIGLAKGSQGGNEGSGAPPRGSRMTPDRHRASERLACPGMRPGAICPFTSCVYGRAALMAKDSDALAYQAAALSETARGTSLRRPDFFDRRWRLAVLVLLTLAPLRLSRALPLSRVHPTPLFHIRDGPL